jgi:hypothetical protein
MFFFVSAASLFLVKFSWGKRAERTSDITAQETEKWV